MTHEEVIQELKYMISEDCTENKMDFVEEIEFAIEALEKQIPKKVIPFEDNPYLDACPCCGRIKSIYGNHYCSYCGQRLDWNEVE